MIYSVHTQTASKLEPTSFSFTSSCIYFNQFFRLAQLSIRSPRMASSSDRSFRTLIVQTSKEITDDLLGTLKFLCKDELAEGEIESTKNSLEFLELLWRRNKFWAGNMAYLTAHLETAGNFNLAKKVKEWGECVYYSIHVEDKIPIISSPAVEPHKIWISSRFELKSSKRILTSFFKNFWKGVVSLQTERLNNKYVKFVNDGLTTKEEMAPQSRECLKTLVWWGQICDPHFRNVYKITQLHRDALTSLVCDTSLSNSVSN